ncbi:ATP-dependent DNA helicase Q5-like isoform X2 [Chelonus insularis]|nr:ATP-dependent DNA helicase Q5-like isoform X2 [Chelonus insularis]
MLCHGKTTIVIVPNKYIAEEQIKFLEEHNIKVSYGYSKNEKCNILESFERFEKKIKFIYVTPHMLMSDWFQSFLNTLDAHNLISFIVVDEAHCMSEHYERSAELYRKICQIRDVYSHIKFIVLTSIGTENIITDIKNYLQLKNLREISHLDWQLPNIYLQVKYKDILDNPLDDMRKLIENFMKIPQEFSGIISCSKCDETIMITEYLTKIGIPTGAYCSKLKKKQREQIEKDWMSGNITILAITHKFVMKFNKPSIRCIIHWSSPLRIEQYYRQIGSHLKNNTAILCRIYFGIEDWINMQVTAMGVPSRTFEGFGSMIQYCMSTECRHMVYSVYFGININPCGDACDFCEKESFVMTRQKKFREFVDQRGMLPKLKQKPILQVYNLNKIEGIVKNLEPEDRYNIYKILQKALYDNYEGSSCINKPDIETKYLFHLARGLEYSIFSTSYEGSAYKHRMTELIKNIKESTASKELSNYILNYKFQIT